MIVRKREVKKQVTNLKKEIKTNNNRICDIEREIEDLKWEQNELEDEVKEQEEELEALEYLFKHGKHKTVLVPAKRKARPECEATLNNFL